MKFLKIAAHVAVVSAKCPFGFEKDADGKVHQVNLQAAARYPSDVLTCSAGAVK